MYAILYRHPDASISEGEKLIKDVYEALVASPKWNETLFLITYDEHGGFFDHVTPPDEGVPPPDEHIAENGYGFNSLGVRIPTIAISPWIEKGTVVSDGYSGEQPTITSQFDSTSILATSNILLGLSNYPASHSNFSDARIVEYDPSSMFVEHVVEPLSDRMAWSNTFAQLTTTRSTPRTDCLTTLPDTYLDPTLQASTSATSRYDICYLMCIYAILMLSVLCTMCMLCVTT